MIRIKSVITVARAVLSEIFNIRAVVPGTGDLIHDRRNG